MIAFDAALRVVHYPEDRRFRIWISTRTLLLIVAVILGPVVLAWLQHAFFGLPYIAPSSASVEGTPLAESASPRNAVLGHAIGLLCGFAAYKVTGMHPFPEGFSGEVYWPRILASALALSLTGAIMVLLRVNHPPAGAITMIVSLGILAKPGYLPVIEIAVVLLAAQAFAINRLAGLPYPVWRSQTPPIGGHP